MAIMTNIQHFMDNGHASEIPPRAAKLRDFLVQIIRVSTATTVTDEDEIGIASALRCQKRPNRKRCEGTILIRREEVLGPFIFWICSDCRDEGRIEGHVGSPYDLSQGESLLTTKKGDQLLNVKLSLEEYEAWIAGDFIPYDLDSQRLVYSARYFEDVVVLDTYESDLDILCDCIAADANHEQRRKRKNLLDSVFNKVSDVLNAALEFEINPTQILH